MMPAEAVVAGPPLDLASMVLPADYPNTHAAANPDRLALLIGTHRWTYAELDRACDGVVTLLLHQLGLQSGDRIAYVGKNSDLYFVIMIGAIRAGLVVVPVNWRCTAAEIRFVLDDSDTRLILADDEFLAMLRHANTTDRPAIVIDGDDASGLRARIAAAGPAPRPAVDPRAASLQLYTSGTTGKPKGVLTSQHAFGVARHAEVVSSAFDDWTDDEVLLSPLPSFHVGGMSWVMTGISRGQSVVLTADTAPSALLDLCLLHGITRTFIVPTLVRGLIEEMDRRQVRVPSLRGIHYGAASMPPALLERSVGSLNCRFLQYYGMTEATGSITILDPLDHDLARPALLRSVGRPLPGCTIAIRKPDKTPCTFDEPGEIWVTSPTLMLNYFNRPEATAEVLQDGWYRSGDGGRLNPQGFLFLTDRIKDMIVSGGENIYPAEVEFALREHPAVADCAVFGLPHAKWGEGVTAAVELRPGHAVEPEALIAYLRSCLAAYKIPRRIEFVASLPRTAAGKIKRNEARQMFAGPVGVPA